MVPGNSWERIFSEVFLINFCLTKPISYSSKKVVRTSVDEDKLEPISSNSKFIEPAEANSNFSLICLTAGTVALSKLNANSPNLLNC